MVSDVAIAVAIIVERVGFMVVKVGEIQAGAFLLKVVFHFLDDVSFDTILFTFGGNMDAVDKDKMSIAILLRNNNENKKLICFKYFRSIFHGMCSSVLRSDA